MHISGPIEAQRSSGDAIHAPGLSDGMPPERRAAAWNRISGEKTPLHSLDDAERAVRDLEALRCTLNQYSIISVTDSRGTIVEVNDAFCTISGYAREELIGRDHRLINSGHHERSFWTQMWRTIVSGQPWRGDVCNRAKNGNLYWVDSIIAPFVDAKGRLTKIVSIRNDITERVRGVSALQESTSRLSLAAQIAKIGVWNWDLASGKVQWDSKMFEMYGIPPTADSFVDYATWASSVHPDDADRQHAILHDSVARGGRSERGFRICRPDGDVRHIQAAEFVRVDSRGTPVAVVGVNRDITAEHDAQARVTKALGIIERQNIELSVMAERAHRVVDDVSHEFRTPLSVIKEFASIIADGLAGPVSDDQAAYLKIIDGAVIDLNHMVEDLLDSSKLRAGRLRVDRRSQSVKSILNAGRPMLARKASARSIVIEEHVDSDLPRVFADEEKVRRVIGNLMTNAIKFSPEGGTVIVSATRSVTPGEVVLSVSDCGPGLSAEDVDRLFGRFQQISTSRTVAAKGFGLGLSIAQELAWLNLGKLTVCSEKGKGATFSFTLPVDDPKAILDHYFDATTANAMAGDEFGVIKISCEGTPGEDEHEEVRAFLASVTYATDLVIPVVDERGTESRAGNAWWLIGRTKSTHAWAERLRMTRFQIANDNRVQLHPISIEIPGVFEFAQQRAASFGEVRQLLCGEARHAK